MTFSSEPDRTNTPVTPVRTRTLHGPLDAFRVRVELRAGDELSNEALGRLYVALVSLGAAADWEDYVLTAEFDRPAWSAEVAAWSVVEDVASVPDAFILRVRAGRGPGLGDFLLASEEELRRNAPKLPTTAWL